MENQQGNELLDWWKNLSFDHKEQYSLNDDGEIILNALNNHKERAVGKLEDNNAETVVKLLQDKFAEVADKLKELTTEWDATEDKSTLIGKVYRMKEYLNHASAIGDFYSLYTKVDELEQQLNQVIEQNYAKKVTLVEQAEQMADSEEWKETAEKMKNLTDEWKNTGHIDKKRSDELWQRIETARDKFFERKREHSEDVEKEMLQNLDLKMELVEKAEQLAASDDWKNTTTALKELMEKWKTIGRTMHDKNEELWEKFITASNTFFEKKRAHFDVIHKEQEENLKAKELLVEKAEEIKDSEDWNATTKIQTELMDAWKKIGRVPREVSDEIWNKFNAARDYFFEKKRAHTEAFKIELDDNYAQKLALLKRAEELQNSSQWRETTTEINELMDEWKKIGPVPRKHSDEIWKRFIAARKNFFARKDANREKRKAQYEQKSKERISQTHHFIDKLGAELKEEEDKLIDFKEGLENITPGMKKEDELREHLTKLIEQTEKKIEHKKEKIEDAKKQYEELQEAEKKKEKEKAEVDKTTEDAK